MFTNNSNNTYNIILPSSTSKEVVEWFEIMENNNTLVDVLIELIHESIKTGEALKISNSFVDNSDEKPQAPYNQQMSHGDFFDNLYNWQGSNNAILGEEKEVKKEKKKMLSV